MNFTPLSLALPRRNVRPIEAWSVYALVDPTDLTIRYIGKAKHMHSRLDDHLKHPTNPFMARWILGLAAKNEEPVMIELQKASKKNVKTAEIDWILWVAMEHDLLNVQHGRTARKTNGKVEHRMASTRFGV